MGSQDMREREIDALKDEKQVKTAMLASNLMLFGISSNQWICKHEFQMIMIENMW